MNRSRWIQLFAGTFLLCGLWELLGRLEVLGPAFPGLTTVIGAVFDPARAILFRDAIAATAWSATAGLLIGGGTGVVIAAARQTVVALRPGLDKFSALIHALPGVAIAPVMIVVLGREAAPIAVAALATFFPAYAASTRAFAAAPGSSQDLFTVLGSSKRARLFRLDLPAALPGLADALKLAAPGAVIGAVLGEWFGAPRGVGLIILSASQNYDIKLLWAAALISTLMAMVAFGLFAALQLQAKRRFT